MRDAAPMSDADSKTTVGGGVENVYGEDSATEEHSMTHWTVFVASNWFLQKIGHEGLNNMLLAYEDKSAYALCIFSRALGPNEELKLFDIMPLRSQLAEFITLRNGIGGIEFFLGQGSKDDKCIGKRRNQTSEKRNLVGKCAEEMARIKSLKEISEKLQKHKQELFIFLDMVGQQIYVNSIVSRNSSVLN
ncbi:hypothetical protein AgCh_000857 [Apium graveolens]